jgi:hypothetical protein
VEPETNQPLAPEPARRAHLVILAAIQLVMGVQLVILLVRGEWLQVFTVAAVMALTLAPVLFRLPVRIPSEIQIVALVFVFATLFLGEVRGYYERFWWWDVALHTSSGLLLGLLGFMFVYISTRIAMSTSTCAPASWLCSLSSSLSASGLCGRFRVRHGPVCRHRHAAADAQRPFGPQ